MARQRGGRWPTVNAPIAWSRARGRRADRRGPLAREGEREGGRAGVAAGGAGLTAAWRERGRGRWAVLGLRAGAERAGERGGVGPNPAQPRGGFSFLFSYFYFFFYFSLISFFF
jgi:hypothetical protein